MFWQKRQKLKIMMNLWQKYLKKKNFSIWDNEYRNIKYTDNLKYVFNQ